MEPLALVSCTGRWKCCEHLCVTRRNHAQLRVECEFASTVWQQTLHPNNLDTSSLPPTPVLLQSRFRLLVRGQRMAKHETPEDDPPGAEEQEEEPDSPKPDVTFASLGVCTELQDACEALKWTKPTGIQAESIPYLIEGACNIRANAQDSTQHTYDHICTHQLWSS